jgi:RNAse (barnase) inhibitor barstar
MPSADLKKLVDTNKAAGVFWLKSHADVATLSKAFKSKKTAFFHLEGRKIEKKEQFLNHASVAMQFPSHFGKNWDAFYDCLTDLEWIKAENFAIYFDHTDNFAEHHESELETLIEIFQDAVDFWSGEDRGMLVLLSGKHAADGVKKI